MSTTESGPVRGGLLGRLSQGVVILGVLAAGAIGGVAIMSYERKVPAAEAHDHGGEKKDAGHAHGEGEAGHKHAEGEAGHKHDEAEEGHKHDAAEGGHAHEDEHDGHGKAIKLTAKQRENAKLVIETAGPVAIKQTLALNGIIQPNEEKTVAVLPRFGGIVRSMTKRLGDSVKKGEVVARIESNESLTQYDIQAPMDGTVIERSGTLGEFAATDKRLMAISDLSSVWVDLRVYSQDFSKLKVGQKVDIDLPGHEEPHSATIGYLSPIGVTDTQSMLARAVVENNDGGFLPGLFVTGHVLVSETAAAVAVKQTALQYIENKPVVFVEDEDGFEKRDVELGVKDDTMIEIVSGVAPGDKVVAGNSFILKAELGKGEAEHVH
ncbi:MAG: efflux RND transporter periplasmic adaptor subunit [Hyphomicrobiaceae bacterium]|nr:efflux RND transporter periplasmic adaptor subunit [Hyphomicrobiaceae bacterium]